MTKRYIKKPIPISAVQYTGDNIGELKQFAGDKIDYCVDHNDEKHYFCRTLEGNLGFHIGDYIIKGIQFEIYPCRKAIFENSYDEIKDSAEKDDINDQ